MQNTIDDASARQAHPTASVVTLRPIQPDDDALLYAMHQRLSPESIYYRYLQYRRPTLAESKQVCQLAPEQGAGFVATIRKEAEIIVGIAYYLRGEPQAQGTMAEPGIVVDDQFQGQGIGRRLWQQLQQQAQADAIHWLRVFFHPNNQRMARLVRSGGFAYEAIRHSGLSEYLIALCERSAYDRAARSHG